MKLKYFLKLIITTLAISFSACQGAEIKTKIKNKNAARIIPALKTDSAMNEKFFWKVMELICEMGNFIVATGKEGASANIKGKLNVGYDGSEKVIENIHHDHVHLYPEKLSMFNFTHIDVGYGDEPCIEIINTRNEVALKLFYFGGSKQQKFKELMMHQIFVTEFKEYKHLITGKW